MAQPLAAAMDGAPTSARVNRRAPRDLELFGGAGGLALGLQAAGLELASVIENDACCCQTLEANRGDGRDYTSRWPIKSSDISVFDLSEVGEVHVVSAGAPCQPFSRGGRRKGRLDDRNLFPEVIRAVREVNPQAFLIENVRGLLFRDMESYFKRLLRDLRTPRRQRFQPGRGRQCRPIDEYKIFYRVLNAADFGLPQNRQRLFIVGLRPELADRWTWPEPTHSKDALLRALLRGAYWDHHRVPGRVRELVRGDISPGTRRRLKRHSHARPRWRTVRDLLRQVPKPARDAEKAVDPSHVLVPNARLYPRHTGSRLDAPAKTVKAGVHGCPGGEHIVVFDDGSHRYFTVRECSLLQGFPSDYVLPRARSHAMRQIGNAVPLPVATAVGRQIVEVLGDV